MSKKTLIDIIGVLLIALVVVVGYKLSPLLLPQSDITVQPEPGCDLHAGPCQARLPGGGTLSFVISPRPIPSVAPLQLEVSLAGREAGQVEVDFAGVDMNMGLNRPRLESAGGDRFRGQGTLPVCVTGAMDWRATVLVESGRERISIPFLFSSGRS